jgi:hypothetical protein
MFGSASMCHEKCCPLKGAFATSGVTSGPSTCVGEVLLGFRAYTLNPTARKSRTDSGILHTSYSGYSFASRDCTSSTASDG